MDDSKTKILREKFEKLSTCKHGFTRSTRGTYTNPPTARDWKWFLLGATYGASDTQVPPTAEPPVTLLYHELLNMANRVDSSPVRNPISKEVITNTLRSCKMVLTDGTNPRCETFLHRVVAIILRLPAGTRFSCNSLVRFEDRTDAQIFGKEFAAYVNQCKHVEIVPGIYGKTIYHRLPTLVDRCDPGEPIVILY